MKKIFLIFSIIAISIFTCLSVSAKTNLLHSITLEKNSNSYNIILNTDSLAHITKKSTGDNQVVLELSGINSSDTVNAMYKGTDNIGNLIIENSGKNSLKIYITAQNIKNSSVITKTINGESSIVSESYPLNKTLWTSFVLILFGIIFTVTKKNVEEDEKIGIKKDIKEREIQLYREYRKNFEEDLSSQTKNAKIKSMMKKIDRKIDERLSNMSLK